MATLPIKDLPLNEEMDSGDMAAIEGGFTFPAVLHNVAPVKLIAPPQPVTKPDNTLPPSGDGGGLGDGGDFYLD